MRYSFLNDYSEGAHPRILETMMRVNGEQDAPYGTDVHCAAARERIMVQLGTNAQDAKIHFLVGGTQVNLTLIAAALRPHQGAVAADTGHINVHESGAIEATGHKVLAIPSADGKLYADQIEALFAAHYADASAEHMVQPGMVYISNPTEVGTIYSKAELIAIEAVCKRYHAPLYLDGARLGCALCAEGNDLTLAELAAHTSAFTIGGTKMGALLGEALVVSDAALNEDFRYIQKQRGGMLAKGRLLGIQFEELFADGLYFELARHAVSCAQRLASGIRAQGYSFFVDSPTNQIFPIFPRTLITRLESDYTFSFWQRVDDTRDAVRLCCSWATPVEQVEGFLAALAK